MLEAAFLVPFLLILALSCWDAGRMLVIQAILSSNVNELAQNAATDSYLEAGSYMMVRQSPGPVTPVCGSAPDYVCKTCTTTAGCSTGCGGATAMSAKWCEGETMAESTGSVEVVPGTVTARLRLRLLPNREGRVSATLSANFDGLFFFRNQTISVSRSMSYLGPR